MIARNNSEVIASNRLAAKHLLLLVQRLLPGGNVRGREYVVRNPKRADNRPGTFKICVSGMKAGVWCDFAVGANAKGRGLVSLVAYVHSATDREAVDWIKTNMPDRPAPDGGKTEQLATTTIESTETGASASAKQLIESEEVTLPPPEGAEEPDLALLRIGRRKPDAVWTYRNADGAIAFNIVRWNEADGSKKVLPFSWVRSPKGEEWKFKAWSKDRPLYNLDMIAASPSAAIVICEGEKAADAAGKLYAKMPPKKGVVATTSSGGAGAAGKTDWEPLAGREVRIWADADEAGQKYAADVAKRLEELGCKVEMIDPMALAAKTPAGEARQAPKGWDAADALAEWKNLNALREAISRAAKPYDPGPAYVSYGPFTMTKDGLTFEGKAIGGGKSDAGDAPIRISAPFEILGESRNPGSNEWGKMLRFRDGDGILHNRVIPNALMQGDPAILCSMLASEGLAILPDHRRHLLSYLAGAQSKRRVTVVMRTGWHVIDGKMVFVLPNETIGGKGSELVVLDATAVGPYAAAGSFEEWKADIGQLVADHFLPVLAVSTALSGSLLHLAGQDGGGLNLCGPSSTGKTTLLQILASLWGRGSLAGGYIRGWSATRNGLEAVAASASDTVLPLDELSTLDAHEAGAAIYALANGTGKSRMARDTSLRETKSWRLLVASSGEVSMETKVAEDKRHKPRAGQAVRMIDIVADRGRGFGVFSSAGSYADAGKLADACKAGAQRNHGTAGPEFLRRLFRFGLKKAKKHLKESVDAFVKSEVPKGSDGQVVRVAKLLGLIGAGGDLATELEVTPWQKGRATAAAKWAFQGWLARRGGGEAAEIRQAIAQVRLFIEQFGESRFDSLDTPGEVGSGFRDSRGDRPVINRAGWRQGNGPTRQWLIMPETWKAEICNGLDPVAVARTLSDQGMLKRAPDGFQTNKKINGVSTKVYIITHKILDGEPDETK